MNRNTEIAALILRIALGTMFAAHGLLKFIVFTLPGTAGFFEQVGFPGWLAYVVAFAEVGGGLLLIAGIAVRSVSLGLIPVLLGALYVHFGSGWVFSNPNGGWEYPAFLIVASVVQVLLGPGKFAVGDSQTERFERHSSARGTSVGAVLEPRMRPRAIVHDFAPNQSRFEKRSNGSIS